MFKPTHLYIKTHSITGLKYFGKTTRKDPYTYSGSGKYWLRHLNKHGYNFDTEIIGTFYTKEECKTAATKFSIDNNIVESKLWANFKIENGLDGGFSHLNDGSELHKIRSSNAGKLCHIKHPNLARKNLLSANTKEIKQKSANTKKEKYGNDYFKKIASGQKTQDHRSKISDSLLGRTQTKIKCIHCDKEGGERSMKRWHFNNCKFISVAQLAEQ